MSLLTKSLSVLVQLFLVLCLMVSTGEAANKTLRDTAINIDTYAKVDDVTSAFTGLNSFMVDNVERGFQQWFWYRVGPAGAETSLDKLPKKVATTQPTTSSLLSSYTLAGQFDISVHYELTPYTFGIGKASLKKTVTITNISAADLDYHLFEYSDYDLSETGILAGDIDNIEVINNKVYQNGPLLSGGVTYTHESSLPPSTFDIGYGTEVMEALNDTDPTAFFTPFTTYAYGRDVKFIKQWDLAIPAGQSVSFTITDNFYPTLPVTASLSIPGTCITYGGQADYTINFDNIANPAISTEDITNLKIINTLPQNTIPTTNPPTDGSVYDSTANTVTWSIPTLASGATNQSKQLTITVNSPYDITNNVLLVSDQAFPTRLPDPALDPVPTDSLCNHPPGINPISNGSIDEDTSFSIQVLAGDSDNNALVYNLSGAPVGMTISSNGLINYPVALEGTYVITVTVTDDSAGALTDSKTFTLTVNNVNKAPVITSSAVTTANNNQLYTYTVTATDPDGDTLSYSLPTHPLNMSITGNVISWTPTNTGTYNVKVLVSDGQNHYDNQEFVITVGNAVKQNPVISWAAPAAITYGSAISATQLNATAGGVAGSFSYSPASGAVLNAGSQALTATFTPNDTTAYNVVSKTVTLTVNQVAASVALGNLNFTYDGSAKATTATTTPADKSVDITYAGSSTAPTAAGTYAVVATVTDANYTGSANGSLVIAKATPVISWTAPAAIYIGTTLSATQLNATTNVAGAFVYTPASGTVMNTTGANSLLADFTPADTANFSNATATVSITVNNKLNPTVSWATPAAITYGTALSASQLNATIDGGVPGSFSYSPASGALLNAGSQTLTATFTPSDISTYNVVSKTVTLTVNQAAASVALGNLSFTYDGSAKSATATTTPADKSVAITYAGSSTAPTAAGTYAIVATVTDANYTGSADGSLVIAKATPTVSWAAPSAIHIGTTLSAAQLNATANVAGAFVYTPASGTVMNTTGANSLSADFTPADTANYNNASATVSITVNNKQNPGITWTTPAAITYGSALSATQLNATIDGGVPGNFSYSPASGVVLNAGSQTLTATFTPSDTTTYNVVSKSVTLTVNQAAASVALGNLSFTYDGSAKATTATTTPADKSVAITYAGSSTAPTAAGTYAVVATITDPNYTGSANGSLVIAKATPVISWTAPAAIYIGTTLSATQLNATANVAGAFVYTPASGTVMNTTGANSLSADFTPADTANYNTASTTVSITINNKQNPVISWTTPATITYGTALSASQLNATIDGGVPGSFSYSPASGALLNAGSQTLTATFTPSDTTAYNVVSKTVTLTVNQAAASVTLGNLSFTYDGSAKAATATTTPADKSVAITYAGSSTAPTAAGIYAVVATITDPNYTGSANGSLAIAKATPTVSWAAPSAISIGTTLSAAQLNATANVAGALVYTPASGTIMSSAGNQTLTAVFTPSDTTNFSNATATVSITVNNKLIPTVSWATPATISYGTALSASQLNATANVPGSFAYNPALGAILNVGPQTLSVVFTPNDMLTYTSATTSVSLIVTSANTAKYPDGDVNGDGKVDISDALAALMMSVGLVPPTADKISHADVGPMKNYKPTPDGKIDIDDVVVLLLRAVGTIPAW